MVGEYGRVHGYKMRRARLAVDNAPQKHVTSRSRTVVDADRVSKVHYCSSRPRHDQSAANSIGNCLRLCSEAAAF